MFQVASPNQTNDFHFHLIWMWSPLGCGNHSFLGGWQANNSNDVLLTISIAQQGFSMSWFPVQPIAVEFHRSFLKHRKGGTTSRNGWQLDGDFSILQMVVYFWSGCFVDGMVFYGKWLKFVVIGWFRCFLTWKTVPLGIPQTRFCWEIWASSHPNFQWNLAKSKDFVFAMMVIACCNPWCWDHWSFYTTKSKMWSLQMFTTRPLDGWYWSQWGFTNKQIYSEHLDFNASLQ